MHNELHPIFALTANVRILKLVFRTFCMYLSRNICWSVQAVLPLQYVACSAAAVVIRHTLVNMPTLSLTIST